MHTSVGQGTLFESENFVQRRELLQKSAYPQLTKVRFFAAFVQQLMMAQVCKKQSSFQKSLWVVLFEDSVLHTAKVKHLEFVASVIIKLNH